MQPRGQPSSTDPMDALTYILNLLHDTSAEPQRRDRAAFALLNLLARNGGLNKKELAERAGAISDRGSPWESILNPMRASVPTSASMANDQEERQRQQRVMDWENVLDLSPPCGHHDDRPLDHV